MKSFLCLFFLGLSAFAVATEFSESSDWSSSEEYDPEELDLIQIEKDLLEAPFEEVNLGLNGRSANKRRLPVTASCQCKANNECGCCASPAIFNERFNGCVDLKYNSAAKSLNVSFSLSNGKTFSHTFPLGKLEIACVPVPGPLPFISLCLRTESSDDEENGLRACNSGELRVARATALKVDLNCVNLKEGKLGFAEGKTSGDALINISVKNPLKTVIGYVQKYRNKQKKQDS